ncbi:MAG: ATP-binding protein [Oscillospiraceae bacterium]|nr:ATP-binding protein [Oscillospiraceae bacterium]
MAIRWKSSDGQQPAAVPKRENRGILLFFFFFLAVNLLTAVGVGFAWALQGGALQERYDSYSNYRMDYYDVMGEVLRYVCTEDQDMEYVLSREEDNLDYYIEWNGGRSKTNLTAAGVQEAKNRMLSAPEDYSRVLFLKDGQIEEFKNGSAAMETMAPLGYTMYGGGWAVEGQNTASACIGVRKEIFDTGGSQLYQCYRGWQMEWVTAYIAGGAGLFCLFILLLTLVRRRTMRAFHRWAGHVLGRFWFEGKVLFSLVYLGVVLAMGLEALNFGEIVLLVLAGLLLFWWLYFTVIDFTQNRRRFFTNNSFTWALSQYRKLENRYAFLGRMKKRMAAIAAAEVLLVAGMAASIMLGFFTIDGPGLLFFLGAVVCAAFGVFLLVVFALQYNRDMEDLGQVLSHVEKIQGGALEQPLRLRPESDFAPLAEQLNALQEGMERALQQRMKSESMKVELITNVSHDLKTPLTSIINYVDLLGAEELSPGYANDYVKILAQKSSRLKLLVQDLFDISKASSGNMELVIEQLDLIALIDQTMAELGEKIAASGLEFRLLVPEHRVRVSADGRKLYRVLANLILNAVKYAMPGTRVYLSVEETADRVVLTVKNISACEMNFTPEDIVERFRRGDESRTTEGSGLGLAIVKSFLDIMGGDFRVELDGDLFKAVVTLKKCGEPDAAPPGEGPDGASGDGETG